MYLYFRKYPSLYIAETCLVSNEIRFIEYRGGIIVGYLTLQ